MGREIGELRNKLRGLEAEIERLEADKAILTEQNGRQASVIENLKGFLREKEAINKQLRQEQQLVFEHKASRFKKCHRALMCYMRCIKPISN